MQTKQLQYESNISDLVESMLIRLNAEEVKAELDLLEKTIKKKQYKKIITALDNLRDTATQLEGDAYSRRWTMPNKETTIECTACHQLFYGKNWTEAASTWSTHKCTEEDE